MSILHGIRVHTTHDPLELDQSNNTIKAKRCGTMRIYHVTAHWGVLGAPGSGAAAVAGCEIVPMRQKNVRMYVYARLCRFGVFVCVECLLQSI